MWIFLGVLRRIFQLLTAVSLIVPFSRLKIYFPEIAYTLFRILTPYAALLSLTNLRRLQFTEYIKTDRSIAVRWPTVFFLFNTNKIFTQIY